jgi:methionyl aminopeptidase
MAKTRQQRRDAKRFADSMREAGLLAWSILEELETFIVAGVTTEEIDQHVDKLTSDAGAVSAPFGYGNFPSHCCTSVNEEICHGFPGDRELVEGDILNVDVTPKLYGHHGDSSRMYSIGEISDEATKLIEVTRECLTLGIESLYPNCPISVVGHAIQPHAEKNGFSVVKDFTGHGTGKIFHMNPPIPHMIVTFTDDLGWDKWPTLKPGMAFTIEPMLNAGEWESEMTENNWTAVTKDKSLSAQWEHTLLMTVNGVVVLTGPPDDYDAPE